MSALHLVRRVTPFVLSLGLGAAGCAAEGGGAPGETAENTGNAAGALTWGAPVSLLDTTMPGQQFGASVALWGDTALVGASSNGFEDDSGSAYVFEDVAGSWSETKLNLKAGDAAPGAHLGVSAALWEDTALVGAPWDSAAKGAVYVFVRSGGVWPEGQKLPAAGGAPAYFGWSAALSGDTALVGAPGADQGSAGQGAAYVLVRSGGAWPEQKKLLAGDGSAIDSFGRSVALSGDTALVGAPDADGGQGAAYVFVWNGAEWVEQAKLFASDGAPGDDLGWSVALSGDTALVGARYDDDAGEDSGSAYVFVRSGGAWTLQQKLFASDGKASDNFGWSVALSGDTALVGATADTVAYSGSAYAFVRQADTWIQVPEPLTPQQGPVDAFGWSMALSGNRALIGAVHHPNGGFAAGAAYVATLEQNLGSPCTSPFDCDSGLCISGVCCDAACAGPCETCLAALGASADGTCTPVTGADCDDGNACTQADTCQAGVCAGEPEPCPGDQCNEGYCLPATGECALQPRPDGTLCTDLDPCTAVDTCQAGLCAGGEPKVCPGVDACHVGACDPHTGQCQVVLDTANPACEKLALGERCVGSEECESGSCADGVCCGSACDAPCHSCALPGLAGTCALQKLGEDRRGDCFTGQDCAATCSGVEVAPGEDPCVPATQGSECAPARCVDATHALTPATCPGPYEPCPPADLVDCGEYICDEVTGVCRTGCDATADCAPDRVCGPEGRCVPPPPAASGEDASCAFAPPAPGGGATGVLASLLFGAVLLARRRRASGVLAVGLAGLLGCAAESTGAGPEEETASAKGELSWAEDGKLLAGDGAASDNLGFSAALWGDTALVGAMNHDQEAPDAGAAYVFVQEGGGWTAQQKLLAGDGEADDEFGGSVALWGDTALVGAKLDDEAGQDAGAAYVFVRSGGAWTKQQKLMASDVDGEDGDFFGVAVALWGDTALVGALYDDEKAPDAGAAYVLVRSGGAWVQQQKLVASDGVTGDDFGASVAVWGDTALVAAPNHTGKGSVYVFERSGGAWTETTHVFADDAAAGDRFGSAVSLWGDTALIGARLNGQQGTGAGAAYVFARDAGAWGQEKKLTAGDGAANDHFGDAVALWEDTAIVGAEDHDGPGASAGAAYVFVRAGGMWPETQMLPASDGAAGGYFGSSVALWEGTALLGAHADDNANGMDAGSAYVFRLRKDPGEACGSPFDCHSGFCSGGVCCDSLCADPCETCSAASGASADGTCTPLTGTTCDDGNPCTQTDTCQAGLCKGGDPTICPGDACNDGVCDPSAGGDGCVLQPRPDGTPCTDGDACTLLDACQGGVCSGKSETICPDLDACHVGFCEPESGECKTVVNTGDATCMQLALGAKCELPEDCQSGFCADGVCCAEACDSPCFSCVMPGLAGTCALQGKGEDRRGDCSQGLDCVATCSGVPAAPGEDPCIAAGAGSQCEPARCLDATHSLAAAFCPGPSEPCPEPEVVSCGDYACDEVYGTCRTACVATTDCAPSLVCGPAGTCVPPPDAASGDDGSCAFVRPTPAGGAKGALAGLLLAIAAVVRRRAERPRAENR